MRICCYPPLWMASGAPWLTFAGGKKIKRGRHPLTAIGLPFDTPSNTTPHHYSHHPCPFDQPANSWPGFPYLGVGVRLGYRNYSNYTICPLPKLTAKDGSVMLGYLT